MDPAPLQDQPVVQAPRRQRQYPQYPDPSYAAAAASAAPLSAGPPLPSPPAALPQPQLQPAATYAPSFPAPYAAQPVPAPAPAPAPAQQQQQQQQQPQPQQQQPQQPHSGQRIDPTAMPNPSTIELSATTYRTRGAGGVPPPAVARPTASVDDGCAGPRHVRLTTYAFPATSDCASTCALPLAAVVSPLAEPGPGEEPVPVVDQGEEGPLRCTRCRAYVSSHAVFVDGGQRYRCPLCALVNEVPEWYFSPLDAAGHRADLAQRPELVRGSVEYALSNRMYMPEGRELCAPSLVFVLDVSDQAVAAGVLGLAVECVRSLLRGSLEAEGGNLARARVGVVTYNSAVHFWDLSACPPRMLVVPDSEHVFLPVHTAAALGTYRERAQALDYLLDKVAAVAGQQHERAAPPALGAAVQAACALLEKAGGGRAVLFHAAMPTGGPGALHPRDNAKLYGSDKEKTLLLPQTPVFKQLAQQCAKARVGVDVFLPSYAYADVATLSDLCKLTGGQLYHYPGFELVKDAGTLEADVRRNVLRTFGYDASLRVRVSRGLSVSEYIGHCSPSGNELDVDIAVVHADQTFVASLKHDERLQDKSDVVVQAALLYTTPAGQRRVRVHTIGVPATVLYPSVFKNADCDAVAHVLCRQAAVEVQKGGVPGSIAAAMMDRVVDVLSCYRSNCTTSQAQGQLILPESMRLLPVYMLALSKSPLLRMEVSTDARVAAACFMNTAAPANTQLYLYPRVWALHTLLQSGATAQSAMPPTTRLGVDWIQPNGVYLMDDGIHIVIWVGVSVSPEVLTALFGVDSASPYPSHALTAQFYKTNFPGTPDSPIAALIGQIAEQRGHSNICIRVFKQGDAGDSITWHLLVEDKGPGSAMSYIDYLCMVHRNIQYKLSDSREAATYAVAAPGW